MCEVRSRKNGQEPKRKRKKIYSDQQQKEIDCDEPHPAPNEKTQPIRWTKRPTGALVAVNSLWPVSPTFDSHVKCVLHHAFTLQMNLTTPNVEPADDCLSHWGRASQIASNTKQNCLLIVRYYFQFLIRWDSGLLRVPLVALLLPLGMESNRGNIVV